MKAKKGFGKADRLLERVAFEKRLREAERKAKDVFDDRYLSEADWEFLLLDATLLAGVFAAEEFGLTHVGSRLDDELGVTLLRSGEDLEDGVVLGLQTTGSEPPFEVVGVTEGPKWSGDTDSVVNYVNELLAKPGWAFTAAWTDSEGRRHVTADYGLTQAHCSEKAETFAEGGKLETPVAVSEHPSLGAALCFAHSLNKACGRLFGGASYSELEEFTARRK